MRWGHVVGETHALEASGEPMREVESIATSACDVMMLKLIGAAFVFESQVGNTRINNTQFCVCFTYAGEDSRTVVFLLPAPRSSSVDRVKGHTSRHSQCHLSSRCHYGATYLPTYFVTKLLLLHQSEHPEHTA
jgi:hypothetical protein